MRRRLALLRVAERLVRPRRVVALLVVVRPTTVQLGPRALQFWECPIQTYRPVHSRKAMALWERQAPPMRAPWWAAEPASKQPQVRQAERPNRSLSVRALVPQARLGPERVRPTQELRVDSKKAPRARPQAQARPQAVTPTPALPQVARPIRPLVLELMPGQRAETPPQMSPTSEPRRREAKRASREIPTSAPEQEERPRTGMARQRAARLELPVGPKPEKAGRPLVKLALPMSLGPQVEPGSVRPNLPRQAA